MRRLVLPQFGGSGLVRLLGKSHGRANTISLTLREWPASGESLIVPGVPLNADTLERRRVDVRGVADLAHASRLPSLCRATSAAILARVGQLMQSLVELRAAATPIPLVHDMHASICSRRARYPAASDNSRSHRASFLTTARCHANSLGSERI